MESKTIKKTERGQSLTELALSFMIIMFVLSGLVDLGRAFFVVIALRDAAQEGAVYASVHPTDHLGIVNRVRTSSSDPVDFSTLPSVYPNDYIIITPQGGSDCPGFYGALDEEAYGVTVRVLYDFQFTMPLIQRLTPGGSGAIQLGASATHTILFNDLCP